MVDVTLVDDTTLNACVAAIIDRKQTVASCLIRYPSRRTDLEPLLNLATSLQTARAIQAPEEYRNVAAARMQALVAAHPRRTVTVAMPQKQAGNFLRWFEAITIPAAHRLSLGFMLGVIFMILLVATASGVVQASNQALPGDQLYPLKTTVETLQLNTALSENQKALLHMDFAGRRIAEISALGKGNRLDEAQPSIASYREQITTSLGYLGTDNRLSADQKQALAGTMAAGLAQQKNQMTSLLAQVPPDAQPFVRSIASFIEASQLQVLQNLDRPAPGADPTRNRSSILQITPSFTPQVSTQTSPAQMSATPAATPQPQVRLTDDQEELRDGLEILGQPTPQAILTEIPTVWPTLSTILTQIPSLPASLSTPPANWPTSNAWPTQWNPPDDDPDPDGWPPPEENPDPPFWPPDEGD